MFEDEIKRIEEIKLNPGDLCIIDVPSMRPSLNTRKTICMVISIQKSKNKSGDLVTLLKPNVGVITMAKGWLKKIEDEDE